jgi:hypothetical protein
LPDYLKNALRHPLDLASGRVLSPGEPIATSDLDLKDPHNAALVRDGSLIESAAPAAELAGDDLLKRAKALKVPRYSQLSADELRDAVAAAEAGTTTTDQEGSR